MPKWGLELVSVGAVAPALLRQLRGARRAQSEPSNEGF